MATVFGGCGESVHSSFSSRPSKVTPRPPYLPSVILPPPPLPPSCPSRRRLRITNCFLPLSLSSLKSTPPSPPPSSCPSLPSPPCPPRHRLRIHDGNGAGLVISGVGTKGRLEDCEVWGNSICGLYVMEEGDPTLARCTVRDHAGRGDEEGSGCGVYVDPTARGNATVGADCVFARNAKGGLVGWTRCEPGAVEGRGGGGDVPALFRHPARGSALVQPYGGAIATS